MKIQKFEDLPIWQNSRMLSKDIYKITSKINFKDFSLRDQIRRAAVSVVSNIAEGFERGSNKEFVQFLYIAKGSLGECRTQLYLSYDNGYINKNDLDNLIDECIQLSSQVSNFIKYLRNSELTKNRYKIK